MTTYREYRNMLRVNKHRLDDELEIQSQIQGDISEQVVLMNSRMLESKDELARVEAKLFDDFKDTTEKLSLDAIRGKIVRHRERISAWQDYQRARVEHEQWSDLHQAWIARGHNMKTLAGLFSSQYFAISSVQTQARQERIDYDARAAMRGGSLQDRAAEVAERSAQEAGVPVRRRRLTDD